MPEDMKMYFSLNKQLCLLDLIDCYCMLNEQQWGHPYILLLLQVLCLKTGSILQHCHSSVSLAFILSYVIIHILLIYIHVHYNINRHDNYDVYIAILNILRKQIYIRLKFCIHTLHYIKDIQWLIGEALMMEGNSLNSIMHKLCIYKLIKY